MSIKEKNEGLMEGIRYKLVKQNDKVAGINNWFQEKDKLGGEIGESITLGTEENVETVIKTAAIPAAPLAVGVLAAVAGLAVISPVILGGSPANQSEIQIMSKLNELGRNVVNFSGNSFNLSLKLAAIPAGVVALSVPKRIFRLLSEKVDDLTYPTLKNNEEILKMIQDIFDNKQDESLTFIKNFLKRVDLRGNSEKFNTELLGHLAYFRYCLQGVDNNEKKEEDVEDAFSTFVYYLQKSKDKKDVAEEFKDNGFVNFLIDEYGYREDDLQSSKGR